jgi:branched-chain amino acid transport system permease protein
MLFSLKAFIIVVLGGLGSVGGAMAGGAIIALLESTAVLLVNQAYVDIVILAVFLLFLLLRPRGLFGIKGEF